MYWFSLPTQARVQVQVTSQPKNVSVMLMTDTDAAEFRKASQKLFGGQYSYRQALSGQNILRMDKTEILPQGNWSIVVMRPSEAILFRESTNAEVKVTVF
jgi:hypothetical protein